jgi:WD40 repeat protein
MLIAVLAIAGCVAGIAGTWSPCGFSAVETIGAAETWRSLSASCAAFVGGTLLGGLATFLGLAAVGTVIPHEGAIAAAVAVSLLAAVAEALSLRIFPQVRRQVPESWRRVVPLPIAAFGYGTLLGLGFLTFVFTIAFWALAALALLLGGVEVGIAIGLGFGIGRALPVVLLAPLAARPLGRDLVDAMAMRPVILRTTRLAAAFTLVGCALALLAGGARAEVVARGVMDPSADVGLVAWQGVGGSSTLQYSLSALGGATDAHHVGLLRAPLSGRNPAVGGGLVAWREGSVIEVVRRDDFGSVGRLTVPGVDALAVSASWVAYRVRSAQRARLVAYSLRTGKSRTVAAAGPRMELGRPDLDGDRLVYHADSSKESRILLADLARGSRRVVRRSRAEQLTNPSLSGDVLLYVRVSRAAQRLVRGKVGSEGSDRTLLRRGAVAPGGLGYEPGYSHHTLTRPRKAGDTLLWTTALTPRAAYITLYPRLKASRASRIVSVRFSGAGPSRPPSGPVSVTPAQVAPVLLYTASHRSRDELIASTAGAEQALATASRLEDPAWSPDGTRVAFAGPGGLVVSSLDGSAPVQLTQDRHDADPSWSRDGTTVAFTRAGALYAVDVRVGQPRRLTTGRGRSEEPAWSPDGTQLAFASLRGGNWDIFTRDAAGREHRLTRGKAAEGFPAWSPDGRWIAFDRRTASGLRIFVVPSAGGLARRISQGPGDDFHASWSPDGTRLAFVSDRDGRPRIWTAPASGGEATPLGVAPGIQDAPAWRPTVTPTRPLP